MANCQVTCLGREKNIVPEAREDFMVNKKAALAAAIAATFMTASYFVTRPGLGVSNDFTSRITLAYPEALVPRGLDGVESFDLTNDSSDKTILDRTEMGGAQSVRKHASTPDQIATLIDLQLGGVEGRLLTNGFSNLFYVIGRGGELFVVNVCWGADNRRWVVNAWRRVKDGYWYAGYRVFRNTRPSART